MSDMMPVQFCFSSMGESDNVARARPRHNQGPYLTTPRVAARDGQSVAGRHLTRSSNTTRRHAPGRAPSRRMHSERSRMCERTRTSAEMHPARATTREKLFFREECARNPGHKAPLTQLRPLLGWCACVLFRIRPATSHGFVFRPFSVVGLARISLYQSRLTISFFDSAVPFTF